MERLPPYNSDAEQGVLASVILDGGTNVINECLAEKVTEDYFFVPAHRAIYSAMVAMFNEGRLIDEISLADFLQKRDMLEKAGGIEGIVSIAGRIETCVNYRQWIGIIREKYFLRCVIKACTRAVEDAHRSSGEIDEFLESVEQQIFAISRDRVGDSVKPVSEGVESAVLKISELMKNKGALQGIPTGFTELDQLMRGLHQNEMIVIAGRPGTGKTSIALNIAESALLGKTCFPTLIFSLEMLAEQLIMRMIAARARVNQRLISDGRIGARDMSSINTAAKELKAAPLWIDDTADITILEMRAKARRLSQQLNGKLGLVVVDYLQLLRGSDSRIPREQQIAEISRGMKAMAKELKVPVIVLAQLNRESEKEDRNPRASDLRESGSIEQDADAILLLSRKRKSATDDDSISNSSWVVRVELAKQRNGPTGVTDLIFNRDCTRYENFQKRDVEV